MRTSRAGTRPSVSDAVRRVSASPVGRISAVIAPRKVIATSSVNAYWRESVNSTPIAPVLPRARARALGSGPT